MIQRWTIRLQHFNKISHVKCNTLIINLHWPTKSDTFSKILEKYEKIIWAIQNLKNEIKTNSSSSSEHAYLSNDLIKLRISSFRLNSNSYVGSDFQNLLSPVALFSQIFRVRRRILCRTVRGFRNTWHPEFFINHVFLILYFSEPWLKLKTTII